MGDLHGDGALAIPVVEEGSGLLHGFAPGSQLVAVVIPKDVGAVALLGAAVQLVHVVEALVPLGKLGALVGRQQAVKLHGDGQAVLHLILGRAGVDGVALDGHFGLVGVEVLVLDGTGRAAIQGVANLGAEALYIKLERAAADLLIGGEAQADVAVGDLALEQDLGCFQDLGDAGLIVRTQQGGAVGGHQGVTLVAQQHREILGRENVAAASQQYISAVVVFDNLGLDTDTVEFRGSIHVGDEAHRGLVLITRSCRDLTIDITVLLTDIGNTHLLHHALEVVCHIELHGSGRTGGAGGIGRRVDLHQFNEFFQYSHNVCLLAAPFRRLFLLL